ncbi:oxidoreductase [Nannocystaceae bacterium ST9]
MKTANNNKVALVTGASAGIGEATVEALLERGYTVYAAARRVERMRELERRGARVLAMDVTDEASMSAGVAQILAEQGRVDVLVNNAGYGSYGAIEEVEIAEGRRQFEVNLFGAASLIRKLVPTMRAQGSGRIINVSSIGGRAAFAFGGWYHATKFALEGLSDSLRQELAPFGIDVVVIEPGAITSEWGGIAAQHLQAVSSEGPYAARAQRMLATFQEAEQRLSWPARRVADVVVRASEARRPRTRYLVGKFTKPMMFLRRFMPDRVLDRLMSGVA